MNSVATTGDRKSGDLSWYISLFRKWIWLCVLFAFIGGGLAFVISRWMTPIYQATTAVMVSVSPSEATHYDTVMASQKLTQTYAEIMMDSDVLQGVNSQLEQNIKPEELAMYITVTPVRDTNLITVNAQHPDPDLAAKIANTLVAVFVTEIQSTMDGNTQAAKAVQQSQIQEVEQEIAKLQGEMQKQTQETHDRRLKLVADMINDLRKEITAVNQEIVTLQDDNSPVEAKGDDGIVIKRTGTPDVGRLVLLSSKQERRDELKSLLDKYQEQYVLLSTTEPDPKGSSSMDELTLTALKLYEDIYTTLKQSYLTLNLSGSQTKVQILQLGKAKVPSKPVRPQIIQNTLIGVLVSLCLAMIVIYLAGSWDNKSITPQELGLPPETLPKRSRRVEVVSANSRQELKRANNDQIH